MAQQQYEVSNTMSWLACLASFKFQKIIACSKIARLAYFFYTALSSSSWSPRFCFTAPLSIPIWGSLAFFLSFASTSLISSSLFCFCLLRSSSWFSFKSYFCSLSDVSSSSFSSEEFSSSSKLSVIWPPVDQGLALPEIVKSIRNQPRVSFYSNFYLSQLFLPSFETGTPVPLWFTSGI